MKRYVCEDNKFSTNLGQVNFTNSRSDEEQTGVKHRDIEFGSFLNEK